MENSKTGNYNISSNRCDCDTSIPNIFTAFNLTFCSVVKSWIKEQASGISEYELLKRLKEIDSPWHELINFGDPKALFPIHFLLFNALYEWQHEVQVLGEYQLRVSPLNIIFSRQPEKTTNVGDYDHVRNFYRDKKNLFRTSSTKLDTMMNNFWNRVSLQHKVLNAFKTLEIDHTKDLKKIKFAYRKKMTVEHPDKGGCVKRASELNNAMSTINKWIKMHYESRLNDHSM